MHSSILEDAVKNLVYPTSTVCQDVLILVQIDFLHLRLIHEQYTYLDILIGLPPPASLQYNIEFNLNKA